MTNIHNFIGVGAAFNYDPKYASCTPICRPAFAHLSNRDLTLIIRQQPKRAKVSGIKDKVGEKPIDPPPIVQVKSKNATLENHLLQNPAFFVMATLIGATDVLEEPIPPHAVHGSLSSSLHKLKDIDNSDGGFFIFPEISIRVEGDYRLRFRLYEISSNQAILLKSVDSEIFRVYPAKYFPGMDESTFLSRSFSDQGARIRIRRISKISTKRLVRLDEC
ncbi:hypothetical protein K493DRAFT_214732 [Basidiobolus meristosporus CBS 931.73]|uniref:Velvet domain-containing protein n=1 Tax=Basidiobolus meristosporus CBS 931.73 TaxID=1314790 RepID=A0A1Y1YJF8_9FUNG|nr:hypothetical protein K493DRAFT_214732 [Basidiobolus meristosporus CBS 931.73]|eukprot:ORX98151.1 hypothetical protein K493DRAFT_214732 [Basidiobolus meristosporus CBS 931.73]